MIVQRIEDGVGTITLDRPEKRNALSRELVEAILAALEEFRGAGVRVAILRASPGAKVWSAGHDIEELPQGRDPLMYSDPLERLLREVKAFPAPVIAMVHGSVWGGATDLALSCDMIVGDETCSFAITPVKLGLPYNLVGLLQFSRRLPLNLVKEMFFTASPVTAEAAARWGILNHLVGSGELEAFTTSLARTIAANAPLAVAAVKEQLRILTESGPIAAGVFERVQELRQRVAESEDYREGIRAFQERRPPEFRGR